MPPSLSARPAARWWSLTFLAAGLGMIILDGTIVAIALPSIMRDLSLSLTQAEWVNALYSVVFAALLLTAGRLADHWGRRTLFLLGVAIFTATSILAALATTAGPLIAARGLQGVGAALVLPSSLATLSTTFTGRERATAFGIWGAITAGAAAIGPVLGGWLTATWSWPLIFWVNVPLGVLVLGGVYLTTPNTRGPRTPGFDYLGFTLSAWAVASLIFSLIEGPNLGWLTPRAGAETSPGVLGGFPLSPVPLLLASSALACAAFIAWQRRQARRGAPVILDLSLFRLPTFTWGNLTAAMVAVGQFALVFVLPLFLLAVRGLDPLATGLTVAAMAGGAFASGIFARHLAARLGAPRVVVGGLVLEVAAVAGLALTLRAAPAWPLPLLLAVYGLGLGLASAQLTSTTLVDVPPANAGQGSATQSTVRQIGSALGTVLAGATLSLGLATLAPPPPASVAATSAAVVDDLQTTAGIGLPQLRAAAVRGELGPDGPQWVADLTTVTAQAATLTLGVTLAFLTFGLVSALRLARHRPAASRGLNTPRRTAKSPFTPPPTPAGD